jgi:hypothetical protein
MSYCRWGKDSDVYVYHGGDYMVHVSVLENNPHSNANLKASTREGLLGLLTLLRDSGVKVPQQAFDRVEREILSKKLIAEMMEEMKNEFRLL